ncbi:hypothetical protein D3C73_756120 [compost metagenome]
MPVRGQERIPFRIDRVAEGSSFFFSPCSIDFVHSKNITVKRTLCVIERFHISVDSVRFQRHVFSIIEGVIFEQYRLFLRCDRLFVAWDNLISALLCSELRT